jgi:plasmid maintenance system antidote protein VapI
MPNSKPIATHNRGYQSEIAGQLNVSRQRVNDMFTGKIGIGKKMATRLEAVTGIPRLSWMYPEEHPNPLIKRNGNGTDSQADA